MTSVIFIRQGLLVVASIIIGYVAAICMPETSTRIHRTADAMRAGWSNELSSLIDAAEDAAINDRNNLTSGSSELSQPESQVQSLQHELNESLRSLGDAVKLIDTLRAELDDANEKHSVVKALATALIQHHLSQPVFIRVPDEPAEDTSPPPQSPQGGTDPHIGRVPGLSLHHERRSMTLAEYIDDYIDSRTDVKPSTLKTYKRTRRHLLLFFPADKPLRAIMPGDADRWQLHLKERGLAENTIRKTCGNAKLFFNSAKRHRLVDTNPFDHLQSTIKGNADRFHYITRDDAERVLDACPNTQWRLLFALARYGGLRVPSEPLLLRWDDIDWNTGRFTVRSPKTEHHEGKTSRIVPLFPELLPHILDAADQRTDMDDGFCITFTRDPEVNLRKPLMDIIKRAGLTPWPKLWQNLRSTRQTELVDQFPSHVVTAWIGNSEQVANKHYLQVTDDHFNAAISGDPVVQNPVQRVSAADCGQSQHAATADSQGVDGTGVGNTPRRRAVARGTSQKPSNGRYWTRTSDLTGVIRAF